MNYTPTIEVPGKDKIINLPPCKTLQQAVALRIRYIKENLSRNKILNYRSVNHG